MGIEGSGRGSFRDLFAERQVHVRSGDDSRYVVLSRPLQMGVAAVFLAMVAVLAIAAYQAITQHFELVTQRRALETLAARSERADQDVGQLAFLREHGEAAEREIERLTAALEQARAEHARALDASTEAGATRAELQAALAATTEKSRGLAAELAQARRADEAPPAPSPDAQALLAEVTGLRAELDRVQRESDALRRTATRARQALRQLQSSTSGAIPAQAAQGRPEAPLRPALAVSSPGDKVRRLQQDLAQAQTTIAALSADLEAVKGPGGAAADLAALKDQLSAADQRADRLGATFAAQPSERVASDSPAYAAPLPSPPAPR